MDDKEKQSRGQKNENDASVKFTRRDFLRGMGTGAIAASIVTVESPFARIAEGAGTLPSKGDERRASAEGEKGERCYRRML